MDVHRHLCKNLRHLRKVYNLTQKEMAQILGISVGKLGRIERCEPGVKITADLLCRACDRFDRSADELLFEVYTPGEN